MAYFCRASGLVTPEFTSNVSDYARDAMAWAVEAGLINGMENHELNPQGNATRAQVAAIMMRFCDYIVRKSAD